MKDIFSGIVVAALGGALVVLFQHFVLNSQPAIESDLRLTEVSIRYSDELKLEADRYFLETLRKVSEDISHLVSYNGENLSADEFEKVLTLSMNSVTAFALSAFEEYGAISVLTAENLNSTSAVEVLLEGRKAGIAYVRTRTGESERLESDFQVTRRIPPGESIEIFQILPSHLSSAWALDDQSILVSVGGRYVTVEAERSREYDDFPLYLVDQPLPLILIQLVGFIALVIGLINLGFSVYVSKNKNEMYQILELYSAKQIAQIMIGLKLAKGVKPSKLNEVVAHIHKLDPEFTEKDLLPIKQA